MPEIQHLILTTALGNLHKKSCGHRKFFKIPLPLEYVDYEYEFDYEYEYEYELIPIQFMGHQ